MENSPYLSDHLGMNPELVACLGPPEKQQMRRGFWGNFPKFLLPIKQNMKPKRFRPEVGRIAENNQFERAKIPLTCSRAFAKACKEALEK
jgi:hypothetical protein